MIKLTLNMDVEKVTILGTCPYCGCTSSALISLEDALAVSARDIEPEFECASCFVEHHPLRGALTVVSPDDLDGAITASNTGGLERI